MIESARARAWAAVNVELVGLYWQIGKWLSKKCATAQWGDRMVLDTADYLARRYPDFKGFSRPGLY